MCMQFSPAEIVKVDSLVLHGHLILEAYIETDAAGANIGSMREIQLWPARLRPSNLNQLMAMATIERNYWRRTLTYLKNDYRWKWNEDA